MQPEDRIEAGYDRMADHYLRTKNLNDPVTVAALEQLATGLPEGATVLDLGCGAGVPATQWLATRFTVTGVDVSARQLQLAREHAPEAILIKASMTAVDFAPATFDAVVALYAIIHVPRTEHPSLLRRIHTWLKPGGLFLATWAISAWEGEEDNWEGWGAAMWWSHYDAETNLQMLREAGFHIDSAETRTSGNEAWLWVLARHTHEAQRQREAEEEREDEDDEDAAEVFGGGKRPPHQHDQDDAQLDQGAGPGVEAARSQSQAASGCAAGHCFPARGVP